MKACNQAMMKPSAALDIEGVAASGLENWRRGYVWPVSDEEFNELAQTTTDAFLDAVESLVGCEQDLVKADIGFTAFLLQHLHLSIAASRLRHLSSGLPREPHVAAHLIPDWAAFGKSLAAAPQGISNLGLAVRGLAKSWLLNDTAPLQARLSASFGHARTWALGSRLSLRAAYLAKNVEACRFVTLEDFRPTGAGALSGGIERAVRGAVGKMCEQASRALPAPIDIEPIVGAWRNRLGDLNALSSAIKRIGRLPKKLLLTNSGLPAYRVLAMAMGRRGVKVVGFHHGHDMGGQYYPAGDLVELLPVDRFVVPSNACLRWRKTAYGRSRLSRIHPVEFERVADPSYGYWADAGKKAALPPSVKSVMIMGYPPNWIRYPDLAGHWSLAQLDLEISLIETLAAAGFRVLYKAHPEWEARLKRLFTGLNCEFVGGHVEDCWQRGDAFVFPRTTSTSFGFALCTNRPIILLDLPGREWIEEAYALLARRCRIIRATVEEGVRIHFDKKALVAALREPLGEPDRSYVDQAMCT